MHHFISVSLQLCCYLHNEPAGFRFVLFACLLVCFFHFCSSAPLSPPLTLELSGWPNKRSAGRLIWSPGWYRTEDNMIEISTEAAGRLLCTDCFADWSFWGQGGAIALQICWALHSDNVLTFQPVTLKERRRSDSRMPTVVTSGGCSFSDLYTVFIVHFLH